MSSNQDKLIKIGVFYDGNYFSHVSNYYNYVHARKSRLNVGGLHRFIRHKVAELEDTDIKYCQVVDSHYFRGRLTGYEAEQRKKLLSDRLFDDILMREGIVTHYLPLSHAGEKGIDVWLALEALELTIMRKFDVVVLIACDGDYVSLVRKLNAHGARVMVLGWDFQFTDDNNNIRTTTTSVGLLEEVSYPILMHEIIDNKTYRNSPFLNDLFTNNREQNAMEPNGNGGANGAYTGSSSGSGYPNTGYTGQPTGTPIAMPPTTPPPGLKILGKIDLSPYEKKEAPKPPASGTTPNTTGRSQGAAGNPPDSPAHLPLSAYARPPHLVNGGGEFSSPDTETRLTGEITWLKDGYGFIFPHSGEPKNLYFSYYSLLHSEASDLRPGAVVEYSIGYNSKGPVAVNVTLAE